MSRFIVIVLKRRYTYNLQNVSDVSIIEKLSLSNSITMGKRLAEYCFYKLNNNFSFQFRSKVKQVKDVENRSCWCILMLHDTELAAKIIHTGRGRFKILNDEQGGKYVNETVDASDILSCDLDVKSDFVRKQPRGT